MTIVLVQMTHTIITGCGRQHILRFGTTADLRLAQAIDFCLRGYCVPTCDNLPVVLSSKPGAPPVPGSSLECA